jgi:hypothetical protein
MRNDQIFVLLLVVLLPLSGCFDNAVGEAEADDERDDSTHAEESREMFSVGGMIDDNTTGVDRNNYGYDHVFQMHSFTTTPEEVVRLQLMRASGVGNSGVYLNSDCGDGMLWSISNVKWSIDEAWIPGSDQTCTHTFEIYTTGNFDRNSDTVYYSAIYSIHEVTVLS